MGWGGSQGSWSNIVRGQGSGPPVKFSKPSEAQGWSFLWSLPMLLLGYSAGVQGCTWGIWRRRSRAYSQSPVLLMQSHTCPHLSHLHPQALSQTWVCSGRHENLLNATHWVGLQKLTLSQFCRTESWHQGVSRAVFPLKPPGRLIPCLFQLFIASDIHSLAYSCFTPTSASNFTWLSPHITVSSHGHLLIGHESYWIRVHPNSSETSFELTTSAMTLPHHPGKNMRGVVTVEPCSPNRLNALPLSWSADIARLGSKGRPLPVMVCLERVPGQAGQACPSIEPRDGRLFPRICDFFVKITTLYFCFPYTWPVFRMMLQNRIRAFHSWEISCKLTCVFSLTFIIKSEICSMTTY